MAANLFYGKCATSTNVPVETNQAIPVNIISSVHINATSRFFSVDTNLKSYFNRRWKRTFFDEPYVLRTLWMTPKKAVINFASQWGLDNYSIQSFTKIRSINTVK